MSKKIQFFKEAVKNYKTSGTLVPSSRFLAKQMLEDIDFSKAKVIVELGPGDGVFTKKILEQINPETKLICFEINTTFYQELQKIKHSQLTILNASAENVKEELVKLGIKQANYIVSSLPLTIIPKEISLRILQNNYKVLCKDGLFIQFQYSLNYYSILKEVFQSKIKLNFVPLNFPPAFVYKCTKK